MWSFLLFNYMELYASRSYSGRSPALHVNKCNVRKACALPDIVARKLCILLSLSENDYCYMACFIELEMLFCEYL